MAIRSTGDIIAENYIISSSVTYMTQSFASGSTIFGNSNDDTHQFTGSLQVSSSVAKESYIIGTNFGIGTTNPTSLLTNFNSTAAGAAGISTGGYNGGDGYIDLLEYGATDPTVFGATNTYGARLIYDGGDNKLYFKMGDATTVITAMTILRDSGQVGIGVTDPGDMLEVYKSGE